MNTFSSHETQSIFSLVAVMRTADLTAFATVGFTRNDFAIFNVVGFLMVISDHHDYKPVVVIFPDTVAVIIFTAHCTEADHTPSHITATLDLNHITNLRSFDCHSGHANTPCAASALFRLPWK